MRLHVVVRLAVDRADEGDLVDFPRQVREELRDVDAGLSVPRELEGAAHERPRMALTHDDLAFALECVSVVPVEIRLRIERVDVAHAAGHEERNHGRGARLEVRFAGRDGRVGRRRAAPARIGACSEQFLTVEEPGESDAAQSAAGLEQELPAGDKTPLALAVHTVILSPTSSVSVPACGGKGEALGVRKLACALTGKARLATLRSKPRRQQAAALQRRLQRAER